MKRVVTRLTLLTALILQIVAGQITMSGRVMAWQSDAGPQGQDKPPSSPSDKQDKKDVTDQTLKIKTELVEIRTVVTDKQGNSVPGLTKADFEVLEDNKPQPVEFFTVEGGVRGAGGAAAEPPSGKAPVGDLPGASAMHRDSPRRIVALFVDNINMAAASLLPAKQALRKFIRERLTDRDLVAVVASGGSAGLLGQFTQNRELLALAIERLRVVRSLAASSFTPYLAAQIQRGDPDALSLGIALARSEDGMMGNPSTLEGYVRGKASSILALGENDARLSLATLKALVDRMAQLPGQKTIAMLSDGFTLQTSGGVMDTSGIQSITTRAVKAGVVIYSIDAAGLRGPPGFSAALGNQPARMTSLLSRYASDAEFDSQQGMGALALDTGGEAFRNTNDIVGSVAKAVDERLTYYLLAYYPTESGNPNKFRKVTVRVKGHPEYHLRNLKGYLPSDLAKEFANEERAEAALTPQQKLVKAILAPLSSTEIRVDADAGYFERQGQEQVAYIRAFISAQNIEFHTSDQGDHFKLQVLTIVYDTSGKPVDNNDEIVEGNIKPERLDTVRRDGFIHSRQIALKPGAYQVRIGVREVETGKMGTASTWIQVPDLSKKKMALSSLFVGNDSETLGASDGASGRQPMAITHREGIRFFKNQDTLVYYFKLYNSNLTSSKPAELQMKFEFLQSDAMILETAWQDVAPHKIGQDEKGLDLGGAFSLKALKPGIYELRLSLKEAKSKQPLQQSVFFGVEN